MSQSHASKVTSPAVSQRKAAPPAATQTPTPSPAQGYCLQRVITTGNLTTSDDHIKGNPKGYTKARRGKPGKLRSQSSADVIRRAQQLVHTNQATHLATTDNDDVYEVPRQNRKSKKAPRRFHVHRGGGDGHTRGFFEVHNGVRDADAHGNFSDSEDDEPDPPQVQAQPQPQVQPQPQPQVQPQPQDASGMSEAEARHLLGSLYDDL